VLIDMLHCMFCL